MISTNGCVGAGVGGIVVGVDVGAGVGGIVVGVCVGTGVIEGVGRREGVKLLYGVGVGVRIGVDDCIEVR